MMPLMLPDIDPELRARTISAVVARLDSLRIRIAQPLRLSRAIPRFHASPARFAEEAFGALEFAGWWCFVINDADVIADVELNRSSDVVLVRRARVTSNLVAALARAEDEAGDESLTADIIHVDAIGFVAVRIGGSDRPRYVVASLPRDLASGERVYDEDEIGPKLRRFTATHIEKVTASAAVGDSKFAYARSE